MAAAAKDSIKAVVVSEALIYCDGKLVAEMSDGTLLQFVCDKPPPQRDLDGYSRHFGWKYLTRDEIAEKCRSINADARMSANAALFADKVRRLGWDHRARGYY